MKFTGKWMELENTIQNEITQTQKSKCHMSFSRVDASFEYFFFKIVFTRSKYNYTTSSMSFPPISISYVPPHSQIDCFF